MLLQSLNGPWGPSPPKLDTALPSLHSASVPLIYLTPFMPVLPRISDCTCDLPLNMLSDTLHLPSALTLWELVSLTNNLKPWDMDKRWRDKATVGIVKEAMSTYSARWTFFPSTSLWTRVEDSGSKLACLGSHPGFSFLLCDLGWVI